MLISLCTASMNRTSDLIRTMPYRIAAANASPPVEIVVVDYNSTDGLNDYMRRVVKNAELECDNCISYRKYIGRTTWHMAHGYNLAMRMGQGEVLVLMGADAYLEPEYVDAVRKLVGEGCVWGHAKDLCGIIFVKKDEFIAAGGYDERFEFYGPEDRDLDWRLRARGGKFGLVPQGLMHVFETPNEKKVANYRVKGDKTKLSRQMRVYFEENMANNVLVANEGKEWGSWS